MVFEDTILNLLLTGIPLSFFDNKNFKALMDLLSTKILNKKINSNIFKKFLLEKYERYCNFITNICKQTLVSIKLDSVSIRKDNFMGVNFQIFHENDITIFN